MSIKISIFFLFSLITFGQEKIFIDESCTYDGIIKDASVYSFASDNDAEQALTRIMRYTGLPANFTIKAADVPNACAVIYGDKRFILYNQYFMLQIKDIANTDWASLSILAHEIGHHLSGHTLDNVGSRPDKELEADRFSGFILYKMGATLEEARVAMSKLASEQGSSTHPARSARLAAITNGWISARDLEENITPISNPEIKKTTPAETKTTTTTTSTKSGSLSATYKHHMVLNGTAFPSLKDGWNKGYMYKDASYYMNNWYVIMIPKPSGYVSQTWMKRESWPNEDIQEKWDDNYKITNVDFQAGNWSVVMTKFNNWPVQRWKTRNEFPETEISQEWDDGYFITDIAYNGSVWALITDKKPDNYVSQKWMLRNEFPETDISENWNDDYDISILKYLDNQWVLVMTKFTNDETQLWRTRDHFPKDEITENEAKGYRVKQLTYGNGVWALVMAK